MWLSILTEFLSKNICKKQEMRRALTRFHQVCLRMENSNIIIITLYVKVGGVTFWSKTERGIKAELRLQHHPYDTESWGVLIREAQVELRF